MSQGRSRHAWVFAGLIIGLMCCATGAFDVEHSGLQRYRRGPREAPKVQLSLRVWLTP